VSNVGINRIAKINIILFSALKLKSFITKGSKTMNFNVKKPIKKPITKDPESPIKILLVPEAKLYLKKAAKIAIIEMLTIK